MNTNLVNECIQLIRSTRTDEELKNDLMRFHENDIAKVFPLLEKQERQRLYKILLRG